LSVRDNREEVEEEASKHLEQKVLRALASFQEAEVDPIGFGDYFRLNNAKEWSKKKWVEGFSRADITTHVELRIVSTGTLK
jgi:spore germination protein